MLQYFSNKPARDLVLDLVLISTKDYWLLKVHPVHKWWQSDTTLCSTCLMLSGHMCSDLCTHGEQRYCCGLSWKWHKFLGQTCDGSSWLCKLSGFGLALGRPRIVINLVCLLGSGRPADCKSVHLSINLALCQTHCKQVPKFSRLSNVYLCPYAAHFTILTLVFQVHSLNVPTIDRPLLMGPFLGVPSL